jgi:hypothetical protein
LKGANKPASVELATELQLRRTTSHPRIRHNRLLALPSMIAWRAVGPSVY